MFGMQQACVCLQSTYVRWKRGHAHTAEEGSDQGEAADLDRPESSSSEEDDDDLANEVAPEEQPSGEYPIARACLSHYDCLCCMLVGCKLRICQGTTPIILWRR